MDFVGAIKAGFKNYANFRGVASRPEYWYWILFITLASLVGSAFGTSMPMSGISNLFSAATLVPSAAISIRRLRDAGYSWTWVLSLIPGLVIFFYGVFAIAIKLVNSRLLENPGLNLEEFLQSDVFQSFLSGSEVFGLAILTLAGMGLYLIAALILTIFQIMPSKSFEQGNKRLKPQTPVI